MSSSDPSKTPDFSTASLADWAKAAAKSAPGADRTLGAFFGGRGNDG